MELKKLNRSDPLGSTNFISDWADLSKYKSLRCTFFGNSEVYVRFIWSSDLKSEGPIDRYLIEKNRWRSLKIPVIMQYLRIEAANNSDFLNTNFVCSIMGRYSIISNEIKPQNKHFLPDILTPKKLDDSTNKNIESEKLAKLQYEIPCINDCPPIDREEVLKSPKKERTQSPRISREVKRIFNIQPKKEADKKPFLNWKKSNSKHIENNRALESKRDDRLPSLIFNGSLLVGTQGQKIVILPIGNEGDILTVKNGVPCWISRWEIN